MPEFSYTIVGPATIYSRHPLSPQLVPHDSSQRLPTQRMPTTNMPSKSNCVNMAGSSHARKTVTFARECAIAFAKDCKEMTQKAMESKPFEAQYPHIGMHFDEELRKYSIHAMHEFDATLDDIVQAFALSNESCDPFLSRIFDNVTEASRLAEYTSDNVTKRASDGVSGINATSVKKVVIDTRLGKNQLLYLDYFEVLSLSSLVRYFTSISELNYLAFLPSTQCTTRPPGTYIDDMTFGYYIEKIPRTNRVRLTFYGYHLVALNKPLSNLVQDEMCRIMQKLGQSVVLLQKIIRRQRLANELPNSRTIQMDTPPPLPITTAPSACAHCKKTFHLFRKGILCKMCLNHVCSRCSRTEEVENEQGIVTQVPVCHVCYKQVQDKYTRSQQPKDGIKTPRFLTMNRAKNDVVLDPSTTSARHICQCGQTASAPCAVCTTWTCGPCSGIENIQVDGSHVFDLQLCHSCSNKNQRWHNKQNNPKPIILHEKAPADIHKLGAMMDSINLQDPREKTLPKTKSVLLFDPEMPIPQYGPEEDAARHSSKDSSSSHSHDTYQSQTQPVVVVADDEVKEEAVVDQLRHFACLDVGSNDLHDKICESAALELQCNNAYVTLIYQGSYILKGGFGPSVPAHLPSDCQLTKVTLDNGDTMTVVPDALADKRFQQSPRVVGKEKIRFYCGLPIITMDGHVLGTVSIADSSPRLRLSSAHIETMHSFRDAILELIESRLQLALELH